MEGNPRIERIMAPLAASVFGAERKIPTDLYNRLYEAVEHLPDATANRLVASLRDFLRALAEGGE